MDRETRRTIIDELREQYLTNGSMLFELIQNDEPMNQEPIKKENQDVKIEREVDNMEKLKSDFNSSEKLYQDRSGKCIKCNWFDDKTKMCKWNDMADKQCMYSNGYRMFSERS